MTSAIETSAVVVWDARAAHDVGQMILRYLAENPPPAESRYAGDFERWGTNLIRHGSDRLTVSGCSPLRTVGGDA